MRKFCANPVEILIRYIDEDLRRSGQCSDRSCCKTPQCVLALPGSIVEATISQCYVEMRSTLFDIHITHCMDKHGARMITHLSRALATSINTTATSILHAIQPGRVGHAHDAYDYTRFWILTPEEIDARVIQNGGVISSNWGMAQKSFSGPSYAVGP